MGERKLIKNVVKEVTVEVDGKEVKKQHRIPWMSNYEWMDFTTLGAKITDFGNGLMEATSHRLEFGDKISIFASTRPEWQISAQACFENGLAVVTVYPSLGPDALAYSLNQTKVTHLITQASLLETIVKSIGQLNGALKTIIYLDDLTPTQQQTYQKQCGIEVTINNSTIVDCLYSMVLIFDCWLCCLVCS